MSLDEAISYVGRKRRYDTGTRKPTGTGMRDWEMRKRGRFAERNFVARRVRRSANEEVSP